MSKAAFAYHLDSKEQLLVEVVGPVLDDLASALDRFPRHPSWPHEGQRLLAAYVDVLLEHRDMAIWIDADKAVLHHPTLGKRLAESNRRVREAIRGDNRSTSARLGASSVLGTLWRPLRTMTKIDAGREKETMLAAAMAVVATVPGAVSGNARDEWVAGCVLFGGWVTALTTSLRRGRRTKERRMLDPWRNKNRNPDR